MPGESVDDALSAGREIADTGRGIIYTQLGEAITRADAALAVRNHYLAFFDRIRAAGLPAQVSVKPAPGGGYAVKVEVYKQLEDLGRPDRQMGGRAVFNSVFPINRTREVVGPVPAPLMWIPRGRDHTLEQVILSRIRHDLAL
jgi:hypothetical protein